MNTLRTLVLTPAAISRTALVYTNRTEFQTGIYNVFNLAARPLYKFDLVCEPLFRVEAEYLEAFHAEHQGGRSFMFSGLAYGRVENYVRFGEGDGFRQQYFLPNRWVNTSSISVQIRYRAGDGSFTGSVDAQINGVNYNIIGPAGLVTFAGPPTSLMDLEAKWGCQYRCLFDPQTFVLKETARNIYACEFSLFETAVI